MGKWTKQEMKKDSVAKGRWQQMVASCNDAQESKRLRPSVHHCLQHGSTEGRACSLCSLCSLPCPPGTVPTTFKVGGQRLVNEKKDQRRQDRGTQGPPLLRLLRVASPLWLPNEQEEMDASASCPGTEFTMHPMSLTAMCSTAIKQSERKQFLTNNQRPVSCVLKIKN